MKKIIILLCVFIISSCSHNDLVNEKTSIKYTQQVEKTITSEVKSEKNIIPQEEIKNNIITTVEKELLVLKDEVEKKGYNSCYSGNDQDIQKNLDEEFNSVTLNGIFFDNIKGFEINFGKNGYEINNNEYFFGEKKVGMGPCIPEVFRAYSLHLNEEKNYQELLADLETQEINEVGLEKKIVHKGEINGYKIIVFEEIGGLPTLNISYYFIGEKISGVIKTQGFNPNTNYKSDIESVILSLN